MRVLYAGDSLAGGPANYLLGILRRMKADTDHLPPSKILSPHFLKRHFDAILLSDFPARNVPKASQEEIVRQVEKGTGLAMIGGWASFSGPFGGWRGSKVESLLPVRCLVRDDHVHFPSGAWLRLKTRHLLASPLDLKNPPVICGLNRIRPKKESEVVLTAREILSGREYPLLVIHGEPTRRTAALATDLAPHWSGGMVDWGTKRLRLPVARGIWIEVGNRYVEFVSNLIRWLARRERD